MSKTKVTVSMEISLVAAIEEFKTKKKIKNLSQAFEFLLRQAFDGYQEMEMRVLNMEKNMSNLGYKLGEENEKLRRELDGYRNNVGSRVDNRRDDLNDDLVGDELQEGRISDQESPGTRTGETKDVEGNEKGGSGSKSPGWRDRKDEEGNKDKRRTRIHS